VTIWNVSILKSGHIPVGEYLDRNSTNHGFLYDGKNYTTLDPAGSTYTQALGVSGNNVVGYYDDKGGKTHGFLYTPNPAPGSLTLLALGLPGFGLFVRRLRRVSTTCRPD
jgi:hypothetical protein